MKRTAYGVQRKGHLVWILMSSLLVLSTLLEGMALAQFSPPLDKAEQQNKAYQQDLRRKKLQQEALGLGKKRASKTQRETNFVIQTHKKFIRRIIIDGLAAPFGWLQSETRPWEGRILSGKDLSTLVTTLQQKLLNKGYITTRIIAKEQNIANGYFHLTLQVGRIGHVLWEKKDTYPWHNIFPFHHGSVLNLKFLEEGLDLFNRLESIRVTMYLLPGDEENYTDILLRRENVGNVMRGTIHFDNSGFEDTGKRQLGISITADNPLGLADQLFVDMTRDIHAHSSKKGNSQSQYFFWTCPFGLDLFSLSFSHSKSQRDLGLSIPLKYKEESTRFSIGDRHLINRGRTSKLYLNVGLSRDWRRHYIGQDELTNQHRDNSELQMGLSLLAYGRGLVFTGSISHAWGVPWLGGQRRESPDGQTTAYRIWQVDLGLLKAFSINKHPVYYSSAWHGQFTPDSLYSENQMSIGNRYTVRGFSGENTLSGEEGWYWQNEIFVPVNRYNVEFYAALDAGRVWGSSVRGDTSQNLLGTALGCRKVNGSLQWDVSLGWPIHYPDRMEVDNFTCAFSVSAQF